MKIYDYTTLYPYRHEQKHIIPALIGAAAAIGSNILTNEANRRNSNASWHSEVAYNNWLMQNETQMRVQDARKSGLNPAFMNGSQLGSSAGSPSYDTPQYQSPLDLGTAMMFGKTAADTRLTNAQAKAQELLNADKESKNKAIAHTYDEGIWTLNGKVISDDEANKLIESGSTDLPDFSIRSISPDGAEGRLQGEQLLKRWDKEVNDIDVAKLHNQLETLVTNGQIQNPRVVQALQNLPYWTYKDLVQKVNNAVTSRENMKKQGEILNLNKAMIKLDYEIKRDSNLNQYIDKIFDGDFTMKDFTKLLVMSFVNLLKH